MSGSPGLQARLTRRSRPRRNHFSSNPSIDTWGRRPSAALAPTLVAFVVFLAGGENSQPAYFVGALVAVLAGVLVLPIRSVR